MPKRIELTGLEITVGGRNKFVGKIGNCPPYPTVPPLTDKPILYREAASNIVISTELRAIGIDRLAWDRAVAEGVLYLVNWCPDTKALYVVPLETIKQKGFIFNLGEREQWRVPVRECTRYDDAERIPMGYTTKVIRVDEAPAPSLVTQAAQEFDRQMREREAAAKAQPALF